ncbi:fimbrial protein [Providencia stuartii]|uniref:fimbrial protein n=1 Tax=Providencia stuartii TaxID=588 RepID=UPI0030F23501
MMRSYLFLILILFSGYSQAICHESGISYASPISIDLSDKLTPATPEWTTTISTQYSGSFNCSTRQSEFGYTKILNTDNQYATILSFMNGKYHVRAQIINDIPNKKLNKSGRHSASELNTPVTIKFTLEPKQGTLIAGDTVHLHDILFVTDLSGMSIFDIVLLPVKQLLKILQWLFNGFNWPYDDRDMFGQPLILKYAPKLTTCAFQNAGLVVTLPTLSRHQVINGNQAGYTPFSLNMRCENLGGANNTAERAIDVFLSSNNLLSSDNTVLIDKTANAAQGIGLRLVKTNAPNTPVVISQNPNSRGNATSLFYVNAGGQLEPHFSIPMAVYYYAWDPQRATQGTLKTTATLNIVYP